MIRVLIALAALLVLPSMAQAGCVADPGRAPGYLESGFVFATTGVACSTGNGVVYQLRSYIQADNGGYWHSVTRAATHPVIRPGVWYARRWTDFWACGNVSIRALRWRVKAVLENAVTNRRSVRYSVPRTRAPRCHG